MIKRFNTPEGRAAHAAGMRKRRLDLAGKRFGRLVAIRFVGIAKANGSKWQCLCDCGNVKVIGTTCLVLGKTQSCGCLRREQRIQRNRKRGKVDSNQSFPTPTTGIGTVTGIELTGTGIVPGVGQYDYSLQLEFGSTAMVTATPVDSSGTTQSATVTAVSYNGTPTEAGAPSVNTAFPQPNSGGQQCSWPSKYSNGKDVTGVYPTSNVASINATAPFVIEANNNGEALVEFTAADGRTGRLHRHSCEPHTLKAPYEILIYDVHQNRPCVTQAGTKIAMPHGPHARHTARR